MPTSERFLAHGGRLARVRAALSAGEAEACFAVSAPGTYAVVVYHDENDDHAFNRTLLGLPAEGYGFSNDAPAMAGLPAFRDVVFIADEGTTRIRCEAALLITLRRYPLPAPVALKP